MAEDQFKDLCKYLQKQYQKVIAPIDKNITLNLKDGGIQTRPAKSNGLWCHLLLPLVLTMYCMLEDVPVLYKFSTFLSLGLVAYCTLFILFLYLSSLIVKEPVYGGCVASSFLSTLFIYGILNQDLFISLSASFTTVFSFVWMLRNSLVKLPKTFTIGEAMIVNQGFIIFLVMYMLYFINGPSWDKEENVYINITIFTALIAVGLMMLALYSLKDHRRNMKILLLIITSGAFFVLVTLSLIIGADFIHRILRYTFSIGHRKEIILVWVILVALSICALLVRTKLAVKATTVTRKTFHVLASLVFMSGILFDVELMVFAAGIGLALIVFVEALRLSNMEPISSALQSAFLVYSDEKDCGTLAMTPLYLYAGLACPLLLVPFHTPEHSLELLSGVLSIGVGDTAASWFGSRFGFNKWPDSSRTMEGTAFNILSQIGTVYTLILFELLDTKHAIARTAFAATVTGIVEAKTEQVDNLILPLVSIAAFQVSRFIL